MKTIQYFHYFKIYFFFQEAMVATFCAAVGATIRTNTLEQSNVDVSFIGVAPLNVIHVLKELKSILVNNLYYNLTIENCK